MAIKVLWDNEEQTVVRIRIENVGDWDEFSQGVQSLNQLIRSTGHPVDVLVDPVDGSTPPLGALMKFRHVQENRPPNQGITVIVSGSIFARTLFGAFTRIYPRLAEDMRMAPSLPEARALLAERQTAVPAEIG